MVKLKKKIIKKKVENKTSIENAIIDLFELRKTIKLLGERETELKNRISAYVETNTSPDSKSNYFFSAKDSNGKEILFQRQARKKVILDMETAVKILKRKKLNNFITVKEVIAEEITQDQIVEALSSSGFDEFIDVEKLVTEDALEQLLLEEKITQEDFEKMCDIKITYASLCYEDEKEE